MSTATRGEQAQADVRDLLRSRHTLLWITSVEESRVERALVEAAMTGARFERVMFWDCDRGLTTIEGTVIPLDRGPGTDPVAALRWLEGPERGSNSNGDPGAGATGRTLLVMRDLHAWMRDPALLRQLRNAHRRMQALPPSAARAIVALTGSAEIPPELRGAATVIDWPLPDRAEIEGLLTDQLSALREGSEGRNLTGDALALAVDSAVGLSEDEATNCFALSLVRSKVVDPATVAKEKKRIISRIAGLSWHDPDPRGLDAVGGLDVLKSWLTTRRSAFSPKAKAYGLPTPKGCMIVGIPGTGKSLTAKALAAAWQVPLIRWDVGAMRSKYVGDSEANVRRVIQILESLGQCVLWLDEIEKALAGSTGPQGDGGVASDALGTILSWMQERTCPIFVVATANDVRSLPPELLRKGRFDEVWWVDLPTRSERSAIARAALSSFGRSLDTDELGEIADATEGFVGAEIAAIIPDAMFSAFADGERPLSALDVIVAAKAVTPLSQTAKERITELRNWATGRARAASTPDTSTTAPASKPTRKLDL